MNKNIEYNIGLTSTKLYNDSVVLSKYIVVVNSENAKKALISLSKNEILTLLKDRRSDWATNLLLYDLYKRDATLLSIFRNEKSWRKFLSLKDLAYWESYLR